MILKQKSLKYIIILLFIGLFPAAWLIFWPTGQRAHVSEKAVGQILGAQIDARGLQKSQNTDSLEIKLPENLLSKVKAKSYLVYYLNTGSVLSQKNELEKLPIASLTKLMTGYVVYNTLDFKDSAEINPKSYWQVSPKLNLRPKDNILVQDLFDSMIIGSANDSAFALSDFYETTTSQNFVKQMNETANELGMKDTSFSNPAGFDSLQNFSTASDLKILITRVFGLPAFKNLARKTSFEFTSKNGNFYKIKATNKLLEKYQDVLAIKTGYTKESLGSMATVIESDFGEIVLIVLHSSEREQDTLVLRQAILESSLKPHNLEF